MKMKNIFVLLAAITLVACSSNSNLNPSSSIKDNSTTSGEILDNTSSSENVNTSSSGNTNTSSNNTSSSSSGETVDGETLTFNFYNNSSLKGCDTSKLNERLADFMNQVAATTFVSSITNSACQVIANAPTSGDTVLVVGSGSAGGELQFTFANTIKSVSITAWSYHKPYTDYSTGLPVANVDVGSSCYVNIDTNLIDLVPVDGQPVEKTESFDINGKTLKLYNKAEKNRAFIKSMTFVY